MLQTKIIDSNSNMLQITNCIGIIGPPSFDICPNKCPQNNILVSQDNRVKVCQSCGYEFKIDYLESEKFYIKNTQNYQEVTEREKRAKKILTTIKNYGNTYEQLNKNEIMEIERDVELYLQKFKCKSLKTLISASYVQFCEKYKNEEAILCPERSVLLNKKLFLQKFNIKVSSFRKYYLRLQQTVGDPQLVTTNKQKVQRQFQSSIERLYEKLQQYLKSNFFCFVENFLMPKQTNCENFAKKSNEENIEDCQENRFGKEIDQTIQNQEDDDQQLCVKTLKQEGAYYNNSNNVTDCNARQEMMQISRNQLPLYIQRQKSNSSDNDFDYNYDDNSEQDHEVKIPTAIITKSNNIKNDMCNNSNNNIKYTKKMDFESEFKAMFFQIIKNLFEFEPISMQAQGKFTQNIITSLGYIVFNSLKVQISKRNYSQITNISYSTLVRETKEIEQILKDQLEASQSEQSSQDGEKESIVPIQVQNYIKELVYRDNLKWELQSQRKMEQDSYTTQSGPKSDELLSSSIYQF